MKEFKTIIEAYEKLDLTQRKVALATVVQVKGSSYRSPGARMLMMDDGRWVGSISGGCLEGDALRKARQVILNKTPRTVTYDTNNDEGNQIGIGLGCNGIIDILIEPIDSDSSQNPIQQLKSFLEYKDLGVVATVFESDNKEILVGEKCILNADDLFTHNNNQLFDLLSKDILSVRDQVKSEIRVYSTKGHSKVFFEVIEPCIDVLIFGGGFDAKPVTELAHTLGWNVRVTDECMAHLFPVNFPNADQVISCQRDYVHKEIDISAYTAVVLMSHNFNYDLAVLKQIINCDAAYIGILGPLSRAEKIFKALNKEKIEISDRAKEILHYPIGLDIGAETPEEIAISIIAEIRAKFSNRSGGFLKYRNGPIHHKDGKEDQVFKQVYLKHFFSKQQSN